MLRSLFCLAMSSSLAASVFATSRFPMTRLWLQSPMPASNRSAAIVAPSLEMSFSANVTAAW